MTPDYDAWNAALAARFLQGRANEPLYLYLDESVLQEVAGEAGVDSGRAAEAFTSAVAGTLGGERPFAGWERMSRTPGQADVPPRFLAVLCFLVFVAVERETTRFSYYPELNAALGRPTGAGAPPGFDTHVAVLFERFNTWLASSGHGTPTATSSPRFPHVGWPLSQAVVRPADRALLVRIFVAAGLVPRRIEPKRVGSRLLPRLRAAAASPSRTRLVELADNHRELFDDVVAQLYAGWNGSADVSGEPASLQLRLCHEELSGDWWFLGPVLAGAEGRQWLVGSSTGVVNGYKGFEAAPSETWSLVGVGKVGEVDGGPSLTSPRREVRWLSMDTRAGGWAEVARRDTEADQLALVAGGTHVVLDSLTDVVRRPAPVSSHALYFVPRGLVVPETSSGDPLRRARAVGGLPLRRATNTYLLCSTGAPDIVDITSGECQVDGVSVPVKNGRVVLSECGLGVGDHEVSTNGERLSIRLMDRFLSAAEDQDRPGQHDEIPSSARVSVPFEGGTVWVIGANGASVEISAPDCRWLEDVGLFVTQADLTGLISRLPFVPKFVVSFHQGGRPWVTRVPDCLRQTDPEAGPRDVDRARARALVSQLLAGSGPDSMASDREWRQTLAALMREVHR